MAIPAFRSASTKAAGAGAVTPNLPAGMAANDIVLLVATTIAGGSLSITANGSITTWNLISGLPIDVTGGEKLYAWWGRWSSGTTGPTVTPGSDHCCAGTLAYSGVITDTTVINISVTGSETTSDTSFSFATATNTTVKDTMVICIASIGADSNTATVGTFTNAALASIANRMDFCTNQGGGGGFGVNEGQLAVAGSMGTWAGTYSAASPKAYVSFALRPPDDIVDKTITGKARIQKITDATITGKANLVAQVNQTITGKADIRRTINRKRFRSITLDQPSSDLTDFPVLISGTYTYLKTVANGGFVENSNGYDISFYSSTGVPLHFEKVFYDGTTGQVEFWVRVPTLTSASPTVIIMEYGDPDISTDRSSVNTWNADYKGVWHFKDGTTLSLNDSTASGNNGSNINGATAVLSGGIGVGAISQDGSVPSYASFPNGGGLNNEPTFTIELWARWNGTQDAGFQSMYGAILSRQSNGIFSNNIIGLNSFNNLSFRPYSPLSVNGIVSDVMSDGTWYHVMVTSSSGAQNIYINGTLRATGTLAGSVGNDASIALTTSWPGDGGSFQTGYVDELRTSNIIRSAAWAAASHSNQNDPANFYSIGAEQSNTITGKANIAASSAVDNTITGKARIQKVVDSTIAGKADIRVTTDKTITGVSRIQKTTDSVITGVSRIQKTTDSVITGVARIQKTTDSVITGVARIQKVIDQTITGKANIIVTTTTDKTITGVARIQKVVDQTILGNARITTTVDRTITGVARIQKTIDAVITGVARIQKITDTVITGVARITLTVDRTITGVAKISVTGTTDQTITGKARIAATADQNITGIARIQKATDATITGKANIIVTVTTDRTITGVARITVTTDQNITGVARIGAIADEDINGTARIQKITDAVITGVAKIELPNVDQNITGVARITVTTDSTINGKGRIIPVVTGVYVYDCPENNIIFEQNNVPGTVILESNESCPTTNLNSNL